MLNGSLGLLHLQPCRESIGGSIHSELRANFKIVNGGVSHPEKATQCAEMVGCSLQHSSFSRRAFICLQVVDSLQGLPTAGSLNEAYADAAFFK